MNGIRINVEDAKESASGLATRTINPSDARIASNTSLSQNCTGPTAPYQWATLEGSFSSM
jgi:hypothetical protein